LHRPVLRISRRPPPREIPFDHRRAQAIQPDTLGAHPAIQMRDETHVLGSRGPRVTPPRQLLGEPGDMRLQRPANDRPQHLDHDALLSTTERQASTSSPDYADLASTKPPPHKGSRLNIGIIRRSCLSWPRWEVISASRPASSTS